MSVLSNKLEFRDGKNERMREKAKGHTMFKAKRRSVANYTRPRRAVVLRLPFRGRFGEWIIGDEKSRHRGSTVSQSRQLVHRGSTNRVLFRDVPRRGLQTLAHPLSLSLSLLEPLFLNKERHALLSENRNRGELVLKTDQWQFLTFLNFSRMSLSNRNN